jgi:ferritin
MKTIKTFSIFKLNENIENDKRLSDKILDILNKQIKNELESSQIYRAMSCWLDDNGWIGASKYFFKSAQEELIHMDKIYQYLFDRNCLAKVPTVGAVKQEYKDIKNILEESLEHEIEVTENWENIANLAKNEGDNTTYDFSQWFLNEQKEEEEKFRNLLFKINLDIPKWELDELFEDLIK